MIPVSHDPLLLLLFFLRFSLLLVCTLLIIPFVLLARLFSKEWPHKVAVVWGHIVVWLLGIVITKKGILREKDGCLYIANHLSHLDIPVLLCVLRGRFRFIADESLFKISLLSWVLRVCGYVSISHRGPKSMLASLHKAASILQEGHSVAIFCEGGINRKEDVTTLSRVEFGFQHIIQKSHAPIRLLTLCRLRETQQKLCSYRNRVAVWQDHEPLLYAQFAAKNRQQLKTYLVEKNHAAYIEMQKEFGW